jgi:predicted Zn-dependent peptidase
VLKAFLASVSEEYAFEDGYWNEYIGRVRSVSLADVQRVASTYLDLETLRIVVVGDAQAVRPRLEAYGPVELGAAASPE